MIWQKIIKKEIRKPKITYFNVGRKKYPYLILPFDTRIYFKFQKAVIEGLSQILKNEIKKANTILTIEAKGFFPGLFFSPKI